MSERGKYKFKKHKPAVSLLDPAAYFFALDQLICVRHQDANIAAGFGLGKQTYSA